MNGYRISRAASGYGGFVFRYCPDPYIKKTMSSGKILAYSDDASGGVIEADNGRTYFFHKSEWKSPETKPEAGLRVIFSEDMKDAYGVRLVPAPAPKNSA
jgi:hypothetical protein